MLGDTLAFSRQSTHNRTRILTSQGPLWLTVPRRHASVGTPLRAVGILDDGWRRRHLRALRTAYGMAPFADWVLSRLEALLATPYASIGDVAAATTAWAIERLGGTADVVRASSLDGAPATLAGIWEAAGRPQLLALPADAARDGAALVTDVGVLPFIEASRRQVWPGPFTPGLSVLDVLMAYGPDARTALLGS